MASPDPRGRSDRYRTLLHDRLVAEQLSSPTAADRADLVFNLTKLLNRLGQDFESVHRRLGWSWAGFRILNLLWIAGSAEMRDIARLSGSSRASISSALNTLERDGFVVRERGEVDRRQVLVRLTELGRERLGEGMRRQSERDQAWFAVLDEGQQRQLNDLLRILADQPDPAEPPLG